MTSLRIISAPGDGIGPEIVAAARTVVDAVAARFGWSIDWHDELVGAACINAEGTPLRDGVCDRVREAGAMLFGAVGHPRFDRPDAPVRPEQAILGLRAGLGLFANLRPVAASRVDLLIVRELTGGIYFGNPRWKRRDPDGRRAVDTCEYSEAEIARVVRLAFALARGRQRRLVSVDKANVMATSQLWREIASELAADFPDVELQHRYVDSCAMDLVRIPETFDVMVMDNLFGDILSDLAAVLAGSIGLLPSASLGEAGGDGHRVGLYEPIHGSAPDIAGRDVANPVGTIRSAAMMLRLSYGQEEAATAIETAVAATLAAGFATPDVSQPDPSQAPPIKRVGTAELARQVVARLPR